ncbi:MAG: hypothetical protein U0441_15675 [Polyangiaceae bacterium]
MRLRTFASLIPLFVTGCTGFSLNENNAGNDTYLEFGSVAVDDRTERAFVLDNESTEKGVETKSTLVSVDPDSGKVSTVADLTGRDDARILFPKSGVLVMSEQNGTDELRLLDQTTFAEKARVEADVRYNGTRMSPSREWLAVADNTTVHAPIHIIDNELLATRVIPHNGDWLEAMWKNKSDELIAIVFYDQDPNVPESKPYARVLSWSMADVVAGEWKPDESGFWPKNKLDLKIENVTGDAFFSFTWVGISPDDKWAVFPVRSTDSAAPQTYELLVVDTETGDLRIVPDAKGPVGFTPDSSTIVSYDDKGSENGANGETKDGEIDQRLLLIDVNTLEVDAQDVDITGGISYFISRDGNQVVIASNYGDESLVMYDIDQKGQTKMKGASVGLDEFVSRREKNELYLTDNQLLYRVDMTAATLDPVPLSYSINHLNILPKHDWLVMSEVGSATKSAPRLHFFDLEKKTDVKAIDMP